MPCAGLSGSILTQKSRKCAGSTRKYLTHTASFPVCQRSTSALGEHTSPVLLVATFGSIFMIFRRRPKRFYGKRISPSWHSRLDWRPFLRRHLRRNSGFLLVVIIGAQRDPPKLCYEIPA